MEANIYMRFFREVTILENLTRNRMERALPNQMKVSQFGVLSRLMYEPECSPAEIAEAFQVTRPSMTNTLQKLEAQGYIRVEADPSDGRGKLVRITEEGRSAFTLAIERLAEMFEDVTESLGTEPFEEALPAIAKIRLFMDKNR